MPTAELVRSWIDPEARAGEAFFDHPAGIIDLDDAFSAEDRSALLAGKALRGVIGNCPFGVTSMSLMPTCSVDTDTIDEDWDF